MTETFPMRVLVVEDDPKIASFVINGLKQSGYAVDWAPDGEKGLELVTSTRYDAAVLDLMLPKLNGLDLLAALRKEKHPTPVLILSAKATVDDRVAGLRAGGDDYLTKPFVFSELLARVQALVRRATHVTEPTTLSYADLTLDLARREVTRAGRRLDLQSKEFALLEMLLRPPERAVTKNMILEAIWDDSYEPQTNVVDVLVHRLRSKIDKDFSVKLIQTLRGIGYVLKSS
jgi:two-component system OmpR family response regulator